MQTFIIIALLAASCAFALPPQAGNCEGTCGTIAGLTCDDYPGTECILDGTYPDAGGKCCPTHPGNGGRDCTGIICPQVKCGGRTITPAGHCCPKCVPGPGNA